MITSELWNEFMIGSHWLGILFNADESGLDDQEVLDFESWEKDLRDLIEEEKGKCILVPVVVSEESIFGRDEISGLYAECWMIEIHLHFTGSRSPKPGKGKSSGKKSIK